jgi:hypothetical protein
LEEDVGRLDVAVDQSAGVRGSQPQGDLAAQPEYLVHRQDWLALQPVVQVFPFEQGHGEERHAALFADVVDRNDVIVFNASGGLGLAEEAAAQVGVVGHGRQHGLHGQAALVLRILGQEDHAHAAGAEDF